MEPEPSNRLPEENVPPSPAFPLKAIEFTSATALEIARILLTESEDISNPAVYGRFAYAPRIGLTPDQSRLVLTEHAQLIFDKGFEIIGEFEQSLIDLLHQREVDLVGSTIGSFALALTGDYEIDRYLAGHVRRLIAQTVWQEGWLDLDRVEPFLDQSRREEDGNTAAEHARELFSSDLDSEPTPLRISDRHESFLRYLLARNITTLLIDGVERSSPQELENELYSIRFQWWDLRRTPAGEALLKRIRCEDHDSPSIKAIIDELRAKNLQLEKCRMGSRTFLATSLMGMLIHRFEPASSLSEKCSLVQRKSVASHESRRAQLSARSIRSEERENPVLVDFAIADIPET